MVVTSHVQVMVQQWQPIIPTTQYSNSLTIQTFISANLSESCACPFICRKLFTYSTSSEPLGSCPVTTLSTNVLLEFLKKYCIYSKQFEIQNGRLDHDNFKFNSFPNLLHMMSPDLQEKFEDTKGIIRSLKSKDR